MVVNGFKEMRALRSGNCTQCGGAIIRGEVMGWKKDGNYTRCSRCMEIERKIQAERRHTAYMATMRME